MLAAKKTKWSEYGTLLVSADKSCIEDGGGGDGEEGM